MAVVGDLFVQVKANTAALTKGLAGARRSLRRFSRSGAGLLAGVAAGFGAWKLGSKVLGTMMHTSQEFREAWANVHNAVNGLLADLGAELGPILADGLNSLTEWLSTSEYLQDTISGLGQVMRDVVFPAVRAVVNLLESGSDTLAGWINRLTGVTEEWEKLQQPVDLPGRNVDR